VLSAAVVAALLGACSGVQPLGSTPPATPAATSAPASSAAPTAGVPATAGPASPSAGPTSSGADLHGTITYSDRRSFESEPGLPPESGRDDTSATVTVQLIRDPNGSGAEFIDAGSTYSINWTSLRQREVGVDPVCQVINTYSGGRTGPNGDPVAFSDTPPPGIPPSSISAIVDLTLGVYIVTVDILYGYSQTLNDCGRIEQIDTSGVFAGGLLACGFFGLTGAYVDVSGGADEIDMACSQGDTDTGTTVTGTLTLEN
jgi:hypothetical protein